MMSASAGRKHSHLVWQCEQMAFAHPHLLIEELCGRLNVKYRTLHRAFMNVRGHPPRMVLMIMRLDNVKADLESGIPGTVAESAACWGFQELGRFSRYYRKAFGELPSETLMKTQARKREIHRKIQSSGRGADTIDVIARPARRSGA